MDELGFFGVVVLILGLNLAWRGYRSRVEGRRFARVETPEGPGFETELGTLVVDERAGKLWIRRPGGAPSFVWLRDVDRVHVALSQAEVPFEEFMFEGWKLTDFMHRYRDYRSRWEVSILTQHTPIAVATLEQYKKRDFMDWVTPVQHWLLAKLGAYEQGEVVVERLRSSLDELLRGPVARAKAERRADHAVTDDALPVPSWG